MRASASWGDITPRLSLESIYDVRRAGNQMTRRQACGFSSDVMTPSLPDQLRTTIRFLGRVLGDVIRAQDGQAVFDQIEDIRQASVAFHRKGTPEAAQAMAAKLGELSLPETVRF